MKKSIGAPLFLLLAMTVLAAGCGSTSKGGDAAEDGVDGDPSEGDVTGETGEGGDPVGDDYVVPEGVEVNPDDCLPLGEDCTAPGQCCTGVCDRGFCTTSTGTCEDPGEPCISSADCCSGLCAMEGDGVQRCQLGGGCAAAGEICDMAVDCCSLYCVGGTCQDGGVCAVTGETCAESYDCCSNVCSGTTCADSPAPCQPLGELCGSGMTECCSELCVEYPDGTSRCGGDFECKPGGEACAAPEECCNDACDGGTCVILGNCEPVGEPCTGYRECCSGTCADSGTGTPTCQYLSGCRPINEICVENDDCCSEECVPSGDYPEIKRCSHPAGCLLPGEVCFTGSANNCCGGHELCLPTLAGVMRCYTTPPDEGCIENGAPCAFSEECCCGLCTLDAAGAFVCCPGDQTCIPDGGVCIVDMDCCSMNCVDGICGPPDTSCIPLSGPCETDEDCCSGHCSPDTHTCTVGDLI